jgi:hypothetical protein
MTNTLAYYNKLGYGQKSFKVVVTLLVSVEYSESREFKKERECEKLFFLSKIAFKITPSINTVTLVTTP